jgi:hypothetical protein
MRFYHEWSDGEITFYGVTFTLEELQAAAAATGLDVHAFRGMHVFYHDDGDHSLDGCGNPRAIAYMEPLVVAALKRRDVASGRHSAWLTAKHQGWQVLEADGTPVPEPEFEDDHW